MILKTRRKTFILTAMLLVSGMAQAQILIEGSVFGGGNIGEVDGSTTVTVNGGTVGKKIPLIDRTIDQNLQLHSRVEYGNVYGGGNGYDKSITIESNVVPGFNRRAGLVKGNTNVTIKGDAVVRRAVYGGGNMASVGDYTEGGVYAPAQGKGGTTVTITGNALIGPKKEDLTQDDAGNPLSGAEIDTAFRYLGSNEGLVFGSSRGLAGDALKEYSFVNTTSVTINGDAQALNVFGSGENGHVLKDTYVKIAENAIIGGVPLHNTGYAISSGTYSGVTVHLYGSDGELVEDEFGVGRLVTRGNVFGGGKGFDFIPWLANHQYSYSAGRTYGNATVEIQGNAQIYNRVFGGGLLASVGTFTEDANHAITGVEEGTGLATVTISGGTIGSPVSDGHNNGEVYGGGRGIPGRRSTGSIDPLHQVLDLAYVGNTLVTVSGGIVMNNVYGGAANGHVQEDSKVVVSGGTIGTTGVGGWHGNVFAGGGGTTRYKDNNTLNLSITAGRVFGDTYLEMTGGHVLHNVYGGGAIASVGTYNASELVNPTHPYLGHGHSKITITGGQVGTDGDNNGMVFGSGRGQIAAPGNFLDYVTYVAYSEVNIGQATTTTTTTGEGEEEVTTTTTTYSGNAEIKGSVYGSGENGHTYLEAVVNVFGGTIGCTADEFAAMAPMNDEKWEKFSNRGNVYGSGCGTDMYDTNNDEVGDTYNPLAGVVQGNTKVNIYGGYISRNVYGAGAIASVGSFTIDEQHTNTNTSAALSWPYKLTYTTITDANNVAVATGKTEVNIRGGHIGTVAAPVALSGNVFGSARGDVGPLGTMEKMAIVKETFVNVNFAPPTGNVYNNNTPNVIVGSVYGSGENGSVYNNTKVTLTDGLVGGSVFGGGDGTGTYMVALMDPEHPGSYLAPSSQRSITSGKVYGNTEVFINGGTVLHNVFGGGNLASVGKGSYMGYGELTGEGIQPTEEPYENSGICTVTVTGGTIGTTGYPGDGYNNGFVFGSSKGTPFKTVNLNPRYDYSRDFFLGYVNKTIVNIGSTEGEGTGPQIKGSVFGGGDNGHVRWHTYVNVNKGEIGEAYVVPATYPEADSIVKWAYRGNVYGAGRGADMYDSNGDGQPDSYCPSAGSVTLNTNVTVNGGTIHRNVYGGGSMATVGPPPTGYDPGNSKCTVNIYGGTIGEVVSSGAAAGSLYGGNVYGAGRGIIDQLAPLTQYASASNTEVNVEIGNATDKVLGNVYGGGSYGQVQEETNVNMKAGHVEGSVYGGGMGFETEVIAGLVAGNATVDMTGGTIERSIYGGGQMGSVGTFTAYNDVTYNAGQSNAFTVQVPKTCKTGTGLTTVRMSGGNVGLLGSLMPWEDHNPDDDDRGWIFCGGQGLGDSITYPKAIAMGVVGSTHLEISNPTSGASPLVTASVYGGCENGLVLNDTYVKIAGGQIGTGFISKTNVGGVLVGSFATPYSETLWENAIAAVQSGNETTINDIAAQFHECDAWEYGIQVGEETKYYVYDIYAEANGHPNNNPDPANPDYHTASLQGSNGHSFFGNVFGGGSGYYPIAPGIWRRSAGQVNGNTHVEITGGHILTSVYGGNETTDVKGKCTIVMSGGTLGVPRTIDQIQGHPVTCYLFGAGMGDTRTQFNTWTHVGEVEVNITGGTIFGSVFGGGEDGHVLGDVAVNVGQAENKTTLIGTWGRSYVDGNVFGGGRGFSGNALTAGVVMGNVDMTISGGTMLGSIYGGGRLASVGSRLVPPNSPQYGQLIPDSGDDTHGHVTINITGGTIGNDYEAIYHTDFSQHTTGGHVFAGAMGRLTNLDNSTNSLWPNLGKVKKTVVNISGDNTLIKGNVYGGGEFGTVETDATITVSGGTIMRDVYGGGYGSTDITSIGQLRVPNGSSVTLVPMTPMKLAGRVNGNTEINIEGGWIQKSVYGGGEMATVGVIKNDSVAHRSEATEFALSWPYKMNYEPNTGKTEINVTGGRIGITGSDYMGPYAMINGQLTPVQYNDQGTAIPLTETEIDDAKEDNGDVYGGGKGFAAQRYLEAHANNVHDTHISVNYDNNSATPTNYKDKENGVYSHDCIAGAVYGGGENGHVIQNTNITLTKGLVGHNIYGGGKGKGLYKARLNHYTVDSDGSVTIGDEYETDIYSITAGKVYGNTYVTMNGGYVVRNIYGGGNMASVGKGNYTGAPDDYSTTGYGECVTTASAMADTLNSGNTFVTITGGQLGYLNPSNPDKVIKDGLPYGSVYGGCRGEVQRDVPRTLTPRIHYSPEDFLGYVNKTHVVIGSATGSGTEPRLYGSVYGGGQDGHVRWNTNITFNKGEIGVDFGGSELIANDETIQNDPNSHHWANRGNVYGAGSGIGQYTDANNVKHYSYISGSVTQFTNVEIKGGTIHNNVYGGGNLATVGPPRILQSFDCPPEKTGITVNIKGNAEIGKNTSQNSEYGGNVYGASRGIASEELGTDNKPKYKDFAYCSYTEVNVSESPVIYGAVFGGGENGKVGLYHENRTTHVEDGQNIHTSTVNINGGIIKHSVYGGGQGVFGDVIPGSSPVAYYVNDTMSGRVMGNAKVNLMGGTVGYFGSDGIPAGQVFGGARRALTWGNTTVNVGSMTNRTEVYDGDVTIIGSVYGANNYNGTPKGNVTVNVYKTHHDPETNELGNWYPLTPHGTTPTTPEELVALSHEIGNFAIYRVFGGSNQTDYLPRTGKEATVHVYQCEENTIYQVFGGSDAANIGSSTNNINANVIIDGGRMHQVFGGGNGIDADHAANIYGTATTKIDGGLIDELFGGSNNYGNINGINLIVSDNPVCDLIIGNGYGGGNDAPYVGDIVAEILCGESDYDNFYGGASHSVIYGNVTLNVSGGTITNLFGGSKGRAPGTNSTDDPGRPANIRKYPSVADITAHHDDGTYPPALIALYDSNHETYANSYAGTGGNVTVNLYGGTLTNVFGGSDANGNIEGVITVNVLDVEGDCPLKIANIYGASNNARYTPDDIVVEEVQQKPISPVINVVHIKDEVGISQNVYGGGKGHTATVTSNPLVNIGYDATELPYIPTTYSVPSSGRHVLVSGNVYGGGEEGPVDGSTTVNIYQGTIGTIEYTKSDEEGPYDGITHLTGGNVFGGGKGSTNHVDYGRVKKNATVNIMGGHVLYNVYGGGELASVGEHTPVYQTPGNATTPLVDLTPVANTGLATVNITGGQVGPAPRVDLAHDYNIPIGLNGLDGYVFGGGKGEGNDPINSTNPYGAYYQFANVNYACVEVAIPANADIETNRIWGSIFGGAEDGHVLGSDTVKLVSGLIGTDGTTSYDGNIFGGGRNYNRKNYTAGRTGGNNTIEMTGGQIFGNIYGGGRLGITGIDLDGNMQDGTDHGYTKVMVKGGIVGNNTLTGTDPHETVIEVFTEHSMGNVYGGGMGHIQGIVGHPAASALLVGMTKNTEVVISEENPSNPTHIYGVVFGGGETANVGKYTWDVTNQGVVHDIQISEGLAKVTVNGGTIGGDRSQMRYVLAKPEDPTNYWLKYNDDLGYVYGGGEGSADDPNDPKYPPIYADGLSNPPISLLDLIATVNNTEVKINGGWVKASVFGGAESGHVRGNTKVTISGGQIGAAASVDAQGHAVDLDTYDDEDFINPADPNTPVTTTSSLKGTAHWEYGMVDGSENTVYHPFDPAKIRNQAVYDANTGTTTYGYIPSDGRSWFGNVFGGGSGWFPYVENRGTTTQPNFVSHWNPNSGKVWGNTEVIIEGGHILNNVYGANESTDVGDYGIADAAYTAAHPTVKVGEIYRKSGGKATVRMSGGTVGVPRTETQIQEQPTTSYVFGGGAGDPRCNLNVTTNVDTTDVQITGGIVYGAVFGGGEMGHVVRGTSVSIDQAAGKTTVIGSTGFSGHDGHVYGGGKGDETDYDPVPAVAATETTAAVPSHPNFAPGRVGGNTKVTMSKGTVLGNLYGGGMIARTGVGVKGDFSAFVTGEGENRQYDSIHHGMTNVEVRGGIIGVGGTKARALAMLSNKEQTGNVYGGGRGKVGEYIEDDYGRSANAVVYINNTAADTIYGSVFGGGQMANVGHWNNYSSWYTTHTGATSVTVTGTSALGTKWEFDHDNYAITSPTYTLYETINNVKRIAHTRTGNVYGGGQGEVKIVTVNGKDHAVGLEQGHCRATKVNISGTPITPITPIIRGSVFGGSDQGAVWGDTKVTIEGGTIGTANIKADSLNVATNEWVSANNKYSFGSVFGGSYGVDCYTHLNNNTPAVVDSVNSLAGHVYGNTEIIIKGGQVLENVYGGGNLASVGVTDTIKDTDTGDVLDLTARAGTGHSKVTISGTAVIGPMDPSSMNAYVFGGGKGITYDPLNRYKLFCNSNSTEVVVGLGEGGHIYGSVFGGAGDAHVLDSTSVTINSGTIGTTGYGLGDGCVYGGGGNLAQSNYVAGRVGGNIGVTMTNGHVLGNVYGGGYSGLSGVDLSGVAYTSNNLNDHGNVTINISGGTIGTEAAVRASKFVGNVFGSGKGDASDDHFGVTQSTDVTVKGTAQVLSNVYGGGETANVERNSAVNIEGGTIGVLDYVYKHGHTSGALDSIVHVNNTGNVFGGGRGVESSATVALVKGNANVNISGGHVYFNVYGGGEKAAVGRANNISSGEPPVVTDLTPIAGTGYTKVKVTGGQVGPAPRVETGYNIPIGLNGLDGYVFGGGKGIGDDPITSSNPYGQHYKLANVNYACVEVNIPADADTTTNRIWGSLFGGAEDGHVLGSDTVKLVSGLVGTYGTTSYDGNIFGGGRNYSKKNYTAGRTRGNITVEMSGGQLLGSIFGGGRLALTGIDLQGNIVPDVTGDHPEKFGSVKVKVSGGEVGNKKLMETFTKYSMGEVFGGGKGDLKGIAGHPAASALLISLVHNTEVEITGDARIYGSVYGGGEVANVGEFRWDQDPNTYAISNIRLTGGGHSKVTVSGGTIGADRMRMDYTLVGGTGADKYNLKYNTDVGHVCGGGKGIVDNPNRLVPGTTDSYYGTANVIYGTASAQDVSLLDVMATVNTTEVIIKEDAYVKGSVFGGAMNGHVLSNTDVKMEGGQIGSGMTAVGVAENVYAESVFVDPAGTTVTSSVAPTYHWVYGKLYEGETVKRYDPFDPILISQDTIPSDGRTWFGNVYGGGSGYYPYIIRNHNNTADSTVWNMESGRVRGNARVEITGGHVLSNVYGGCETTNVDGSATVILGDASGKPTVGVPRVANDIKALPLPGYVYGSGNGDPRTNFNTCTNVASSHVVMNRGIVYGCVFGGGMDGHVLGDTHVEVENGTIGVFGSTGAEGNVFGGGRGSNPVALTAGGVGGNTRVDIKDGRMLGSIFGGGNNGSVGIQFTAPDASNYGEILDDNPSTNEYHGYTTVNISGGSIGHEDATGRTGGNVYGGCRGMAGAPGSIYQRMAKVKTTHVNIWEAQGKQTFIRGSVFGAGEDGHVKGDTYVTVSGGQIGGESYADSGEEPIVCRDIYHGNVYGGGRGLNTYTDATGEHYSITAGKVDHNTYVVIKGGRVTRNVYGGGNIASVGEYRTDESGNLVVVDGEYVPETGTGLAQVTIKGGMIGVYNDDDLTHGNVFGSSHGLAGALYKDLAYVHNTEVRLDSVAVVYGAVFGGGEDGHVNQHALVSVNGNAVVGHENDVDSKGNVYGGGRGVDLDETQTPPVLSPTAGLVKGHTRVYINSGHLYGSVYGGGHTSKVQEERVVNINGGIVEGNVFGGGNTSASEDTYYTSMKTVNVRGGQIKGNVFGCSYSANEGDTTQILSASNPYWTSFVNITGGTIGTTGGSNGNVYAAGYAGEVKGSVCINIGANAINNAPNKTANLYREDAEGNTSITPSAPTDKDLVIKGSVYGGSNLVGTNQTIDRWNTYDISGYSKIYIDGTGYDTRANVTPYMDLQGGLYGCGTHCESGKLGRDVFLRKYGARNTDAKSEEMTSATRTLLTAQRIGNFVIDESNVNFSGYRDISGKSDSLYAVVKINENLYAANASSLVLGSLGTPAYMDSIVALHSTYLTSGEIYADDDVTELPWGWIGLKEQSSGFADELLYMNGTSAGATLNKAQENVILFNGISRLWVRYHDGNTQKYGELEGFFRMRGNHFQPYGNESFAYARPKLTVLNGGASSSSGEDNKGDGGFLSYNTSFNFHTSSADGYQAEGNDGGNAHTNTKQYPYSNVMEPSAKGDMEEFRLWAIPRITGRPWYVDGRTTGGIGVNDMAEGRGLYPNMPKMTVSADVTSEEDNKKGIYAGAYDFENTTTRIPFNQEKDVIYVVGAVNSTKELAVNASGILNAEPVSTKPLRLYRYPGGHALSPTSGATDPGANYKAMIEVNNNDALTLNKVVVDGLFGYEGYDAFNYAIPTSFNEKGADRPLVIAYGGSTLTLCDSTTLKNGYNKTDADLWYKNADYKPYNASGALTDYHGGGLFVDSTAVVNVKDSVYITGNKQYRLVNGLDHPVNCNVYLPTFNDSYLTITGELFRKTRIGVTSPKRNKEKLYDANTFSPVAVATDKSDAVSAWNNNNFVDDQGWFFGRNDKTTYFIGEEGTILEQKTLYFGWTWANVVRTQPSAADYAESTGSITVKSEKGLAWLISKSVGMNGETATDFSDVNISQTADVDMKQYVWVPLGYESRPFKGQYDGRGHLIDSLFVQYLSKSDTRYQRNDYGMFGKVNGSTDNSGVVNRTFVVGGKIAPASIPDVNRDVVTYYIGGLVGQLEGDHAMVSNSEASNVIDCPNFDGHEVVAGGLVGQMNNGHIHSSMTMSTINMGSLVQGPVGGLVGKAEAGDIYNSFANVGFEITGSQNTKTVGGLLGNNTGAKMSNCYLNLRNAEGLTTTNFRSIVYNNTTSATNIDSCYVMQTTTEYSMAVTGGCDASCHKYTPVIGSDNLGYMYADNRVEGITSKTDSTLFQLLNKWVSKKDPEYGRWARPALAEINGDLPVLLLNVLDGDDVYQGDLRSVGTYAGGPALQYGGPVRDGEADSENGVLANELDAALTRPLEKNKSNVDIPDYLFVYGDVNQVGSSLTITQSKVSIHEDVSIMGAGDLTTFDNTYVGITFDNSFGHATSTPGVNIGLNGLGIGPYPLPRDWHMFSTPLNNAPQGFDYGEDNAPDGPSNNPWVLPGYEFNWLTTQGSDECASGADNRYWMKEFVATDQKTDGYFPTRRGSLFDGHVNDLFIVGSDECPSENGHRYPYGMDFYTWTEPDYHWINFKRNGPNHWHSDEPHEHLNYVPYQGATANQNEDKLIVGRGYMAAITTGTFMQSHGILNDGDQSIPLTLTPSSKLKGWNLVGNPFHSYLDFDKVATGNNLDVLSDQNYFSGNADEGAFYVVYNADKYQNQDASTAFRYYPVGGSKGGDYAERYLHPHQGFYVRAKTGGALQFKESMLVPRSEIEGESTFRDDRPAYPLVNLYLSSDQGCADVTVIEFERPEWGGATKLKELRVGDGLFYAQHDNTHYAALFAQQGIDRVPVWFEAKEDDIFTLKWNTANADFHSMYLIDHITGIEYDMLRNDTYTFEGHKGDYPSRFLIVFSLTDVEEHNEIQTFVFFDGSQWIVTGDGQLDFVDPLGQVLMSKEVHGGQSRVGVPDVAPGVYLFRLTNSEGTRIQKVVVKR